MSNDAIDVYKLWNFVTEQSESVTSLPEDLSPYFPQHPAHQNLYSLYLLKGDTPKTALYKVLSLCAKEHLGNSNVS